jgi:hypothetical protein
MPSKLRSPNNTGHAMRTADRGWRFAGDAGGSKCALAALATSGSHHSNRVIASVCEH